MASDRKNVCAHLENYVSLLQVTILGSQACTGHLFDEDLTPQTQAIFYTKTYNTVTANYCSLLSQVHEHSTTMVAFDDFLAGGHIDK